ncbi:MAG: RHS repeat-associated core domain-containing protein [Chloroflexota bacterium]
MSPTTQSSKKLYHFIAIIVCFSLVLQAMPLMAESPTASNSTSSSPSPPQKSATLAALQDREGPNLQVSSKGQRTVPARHSYPSDLKGLDKIPKQVYAQQAAQLKANLVSNKLGSVSAARQSVFTASRGNQATHGPPALPNGLTMREMASRTRAMPNAATFTPRGKALSVDLPLGVGWHLLSIPEELSSTDPATVLASIAGSSSRAYAYDACDVTDPWKLYDPSDPAASDLTVIDHKMGFWVEMTTADTFTTIGVPPTDKTIQLCPGWNLVGYPVDQSLPVAGALQSIDGRYATLFAFDPSIPEEPWDAFDLTAPDWVDDLQMMVPGRGYWIFATEATDLTYSLPGQALSLQLTNPSEGTTITEPITVTGLIESDSQATWTLEYRLQGEVEWVPFGTGDTSVSNQVFSLFDPTMLLNGLYEIRLQATDLFGQTVSTEAHVVVEGNMKIGNFGISFTDLDIPVAGIPIQIVRSYDSRDQRVGDFGVGWTLDIADVRIQEAVPVGLRWQQTVSQEGLFNTYCIEPTDFNMVTVSFTDGSVQRFRPVPIPECQALTPIDFVQITFVPLPGSQGSMAPLAPINALVLGGSVGPVQLIDDGVGLPYDIDEYELELQDGRVLQIDQEQGLERLIDRNGNNISITDNGIIHSAGKSIPFQRDSSGRVTSITDPLGNSLTYTYDSNGDLITVTDQNNDDTTYAYNGSHGLLHIVDPQGMMPARNEYDADGRLIAMIDADGNRTELTHTIGSRQEIIRDRSGSVTVFEYDARGNIVSKTDALGNTELFSWDDQDNKLSQTDPLGNTSTWAYDERGNTLTHTDPLGNTSTWTYNTNNQILSATDARGNSTTYTYDGNGNLLTVTDRENQVKTYTYNSSGNRLTTVDALGNVTTYTYDASGNRLSSTDPLGAVITHTYDANGNRLTETINRTDASGTPITMVTTMTYDSKDRHIQTVDASGETTSIEYNDAGRQSARSDANNHRTEFQYDARGNLTRTLYPDGTEELTTYDAEGRQASFTNRAGNVTSFTYDALGRLTQTTFSDNTSVELEYDTAGRVLRRIDERNNATQFSYDGAGNRITTTDPLGFVTTYFYDANGNLVQMDDANGHSTQYTYDGENRRASVIFDDGTTQLTLYDALGRAITKTDQANNSTGFGYDPRGRLSSVTDALGNVMLYTYDEVGNQIAQTDANGNVTAFAYDNLGRQIARTLPLGMTETFGYDPVGNRTLHTNFNGETVTFQYNDMDLLTRKILADGSVVDLTYTDMDQINTVTDARGATQHTYDNRERLTQLTYPEGATLSYTYDAASNRTSVTGPAGVVTYSYDDLNRLETVTDPLGGVTTYAYDSVGNRASIGYPNGTSTAYTYDTLNRLTEIEQMGPGNVQLARYNYTLGATGNRIQLSEDGGRVVNYTYDALYRLTEEEDTIGGTVTTTTYTYDAVGNRLDKTENGVATTYTYDANLRLLSAGAVAYGYDNNGNMVSQVDGGGTTTLQYDAENRLVRQETPTGVVSTYVYDIFGDRMQRVVDGIITQFVVDPMDNSGLSQVLAEQNSMGSILAHYVYGDDLVSLHQGNSSHYYHYDGTGSTRLLSDGSAAISDSYLYDAFGNLLTSSGTTENVYLFAGEQFDPYLNFYYLRARYMDPQLGRFVSMDPFSGFIFDPPSLHKYTYAHNNPVNLIDPTGYFSISDLSATVSAYTVLSTMVLTHFTFAMVTVKIIDALFKPGFALRESGMLLMSATDDQAVQTHAMQVYRHGNSLIGLGSVLIGVANDILQLAQTFASLSGAIRGLANIDNIVSGTANALIVLENLEMMDTQLELIDNSARGLAAGLGQGGPADDVKTESGNLAVEVGRYTKAGLNIIGHIRSYESTSRPLPPSPINTNRTRTHLPRGRIR